jgi:hypothetical protein
VKAAVIPVIIRANGTISKPMRKYMTNISGKHEIRELQKTAILSTAHISAYVQVQNIKHGT